MERFAGQRNIMLATGGAREGPSRVNDNVQWIFSSSLWRKDLEATAPRDRSPLDAVRIAIVCRQEKSKGTGQVIRSLPLVLEHYPSARLNVVGDGSDLGSFKQLAAEAGVADRVTFYGGLPHADVLKVLAANTLFCYPTASEGFPKVVLEALACALPVVTTRVSVLPELLASGCGVLLDDTTPEAIAQGIREALSPERYAAMSRRATETARQYSLEDWRDRIAERLREAWGPLRAA
jgi:glycosyltransferase involved in cell wall biosynthesis